MFVIKPADAYDVTAAFHLLSRFPEVAVTIKALYERASVKAANYLLIAESEDVEALRLLEANFQMTFMQKPMHACPICKEEGEEFCGHLVFTNLIGRQ